MSSTAPAPLDLIASAVAGYDAGAMPVAQAQEFIARLATPVQAVEHVPLRSALGRVLAQDVVSTIDVPSHDNAAMDGYALRGLDLATDGETLLAVAGTGLAGQSVVSVVPPGFCVRIMTGAVMPDGLDTVVPQEFVTVLDDGRISVAAGLVRIGDNRRLRGDDLAKGEAALRAGRIVKPADLGVLASLGRAEVAVFRRLRVAFFSTGDELRSIGEALDDGCVYDSNRYTLWGMLHRLGVEALDFGLVRDDPVALHDMFSRAAEAADVVITSGGVSLGEADHTKRVMAELGEVLFWRLAMRPGRPLAVGRIGAASADGHGRQALLFGLPGNPVAVMVSFYAFVRDALLAMSGATPGPLPTVHAATTVALRKKPGRTEYQRGTLQRAADGRWQVTPTGAQGSGILHSMSQAHGLIVLPHAQGHVGAGEAVEVIPFDGLA
jgi:molybdopterin molybdotransferase